MKSSQNIAAEVMDQVLDLKSIYDLSEIIQEMNREEETVIDDLENEEDKS
jgi:hypothetical protein